MWLVVQRLRPATLRFDALHPPMTGVPQWLIDVDTAPASELQLLPSIGPKLAQRIVDDRVNRGPFGGLRGLDRVSGIGPVALERLAPFVRSTH